ncbi:MAG: hypothetical protein QXU98_12825 [Candidatus Parvarchaeota archaeon]
MLTYSDLICKMMGEYGYSKIEQNPKDYLFFSSSSKTLIIYIAQKNVTGEDVLKHAKFLEQLDSQKYIICLHDYTSDACETAQKFNIILNSRMISPMTLGNSISKKDLSNFSLIYYDTKIRCI